jgi:hypothetical protein
MKFLEYVERGRKGLNTGLYNCFRRFNTHLCNTQKATYYAIGGLPGSGKSALADDCFILSPFFFYKQRDGKVNIHWNYFSFEINYVAKRAKWTAYRLFEKYGVHVDSNYILSKGKNRINDRVYQAVCDVENEMDELFDHIDFHDEPLHPTAIWNYMLSYAKKAGNVQFGRYYDENGVEKSFIKGYQPHDPRHHVINIVDHVALINSEQGLNTKGKIDKLSEYFVKGRNRFWHTQVAISQFHRGLTAVERQKFKGSILAPTLEDFKDTGNIGQDCNVALGTFNPYKLDLDTYLGYDINKTPYGLQDNFRAVNIMKNRDGEDWQNIGMYFQGGLGRFRELPHPSKIDQALLLRLKQHLPKRDKDGRLILPSDVENKTVVAQADRSPERTDSPAPDSSISDNPDTVTLE